MILRVRASVLAGLAGVLACTSKDPGAGASGAASAIGTGCPAVGAPVVAGQLTSREISEASGIAASAKNPGVYWTHNDSGDGARAFAVSSSGELLASLDYGATVADVEDMAIQEVGPGEAYLYFADIGDNAVNRESIAIFRVAEPALTRPRAGGVAVSLSASAERMDVRYADGPHDAETLLLDPLSGDLFVATKKIFGGSGIYRVGPFHGGSEMATAERVASSAADFVTGGNVSRDGRLVVLRNYGTSAYVWTRDADTREPLAAVFSRAACRVPIATEAQGEAIAFLASGSGYVTVSEGASAALHVALFE